MTKQILHITNGSSLTSYLNDLDFEGEFLTWEEMLCEGPTAAGIDSDEFYNIRKTFLQDIYGIEIDEKEYKRELGKLNNPGKFTEINLWFEYDLFCHINLIAVISLIHQRGIDLPLFLICSGRVEGEKALKGLPELTPEQLMDHYQNKIRLNEDDIDMAIALWRTYCGKDHNILKPYIVKSSSYPYLSNCLKAHLERFPDSRNGLNNLERNILEIVRTNNIKSRHHLLGYALNYQGYYGFGDIQFERLINNLSIFFTESSDALSLNRKGHEALINQHNFASELNNNIDYGGVNRLKFQFNVEENKLIKTI
ncbi:MAG: DUF1835 domain-containing protein [Bacteroidia bacterium]|nr:DUF1835 domain-containing protein [Bacteroidia bacterium]